MRTSHFSPKRAGAQKMAVILQIDFTFEGPFGQDLAGAMTGLAESINSEPGFLWKIWTENPDTGQAGGIYLFSDKKSAQAFMTKHSERLRSFGIMDARSRLFEVNQALTKMTSGPV